MLFNLPLSVGVTGHRTLPCEHLQRIERQVRQILTITASTSEKITDSHPDVFAQHPLLVVNSCLSEGADRMVARIGLENGFALDVALPFHRESSIHARDLEGDAQRHSREELAEILTRSRNVLELGYDEESIGQSDDAAAGALRQKAYLAAGLRVIEHSDMVLTLWNGKKQSNPGSTYDIMTRAAQQNRIVLWIHTESNCDVQLCEWNNNSLVYKKFQPNKGALRNVLFERFAPPKQNGVPALDVGLAECLTDMDCHKRNPPLKAGLWKKFYNTIAPPQPSLPGAVVAPFTQCVSCPPQILEKQYTIFSDLAGYYAHMHRSFFFLSPLLGTLAVTVAVLALVLPASEVGAKVTFGLTELLFLLVLLKAHKDSTDEQWQRKLTDYRLLAEVLRHAIFMHGLGLAPSMQESLPYYDKKPDGWLYWLIRILRRGQGLPNHYWGRVRSEQKECLSHWLMEQSVYHAQNAHRSALAEHRLHLFCNILVWMTLFLVALHVLLELLHFPFVPHGVMAIMNALTILLPLWAMGAHALCQYAELRRLHDRSKSMTATLEALKREMENAQTYSEVVGVAEDAAAMMLIEVLEWNVQYKMPEVSRA